MDFFALYTICNEADVVVLTWPFVFSHINSFCSVILYDIWCISALSCPSAEPFYTSALMNYLLTCWCRHHRQYCRLRLVNIETNLYQTIDKWPYKKKGRKKLCESFHYISCADLDGGEGVRGLAPPPPPSQKNHKSTKPAFKVVPDSPAYVQKCFIF